MTRSYKFIIYPNKSQEELIQRTFHCSLFVYNHFLSRRIDEYKNNKKNLGYNLCSKELTELKKRFSWLCSVDKWALQNSLKNLDSAYQRFFKCGAGFPKFKKESATRKSYRTTSNNNNIECVGGKIKLPKLGWVRFRDNIKGISYKILNATISQVPSGKYYCSICFEIQNSCGNTGNKSIGIDVGVSDYAVLSNGDKIENPKYMKSFHQKIIMLSRRFSKKKEDSKNREKARIKLARAWEKLSNKRKDFIHKLTKELISRYDVLCIETLDIESMKRKHRISSLICDASWYEFSRQLKYKAETVGKTVLSADKFFPSSQLCSNCGYKNDDIKDLSIRFWKCPVCHEIHDRDINAAKNLLSIM